MNQYQTLYTCDDEYGNIKVLDDGQYRILSFTDGDEQSRQKIATPDILQHEYTQAMMLVLLFKQPKRITILGLGGGCLVTTLHKHVAGLQINAIELRPQVIDIAERFFRLPKSKKITIVEQDANHYLAKNEHKKVDVLFTDIYNTKGMDGSVLRQTFIDKCADNIKDDGWLVINCWSEHTFHPELIEALQHHFIDIRAVNTGCGNWVVLAGKRYNDGSGNQLKAQAQKLSNDLGFNVNTWLSRLTEV